VPGLKSKDIPPLRSTATGLKRNTRGRAPSKDSFEFVDEELAMKCDVNNMKESGCSEKAEKYAPSGKGKKPKLRKKLAVLEWNGLKKV
jgi:hypothetical protein